MAITNDFFSKSESPKDYYQEILLDYKGNLIPVYQTWVDTLFKKKDILIYNNCPVFKYQDSSLMKNLSSANCLIKVPPKKTFLKSDLIQIFELKDGI